MVHAVDNSGHMNAGYFPLFYFIFWIFFFSFETIVYFYTAKAKEMKMAEYRKIVKEYLHEKRGLDDEVLKKYQVGFTVQQFLIDNEEGESEWQDQICITFPWIQFADQIVGENGKVKESYTFSSFDKNKSKTKAPKWMHC